MSQKNILTAKQKKFCEEYLEPVRWGCIFGFGWKFFGRAWLIFGFGRSNWVGWPIRLGKISESLKWARTGCVVAFESYVCKRMGCVRRPGRRVGLGPGRFLSGSVSRGCAIKYSSPYEDFDRQSFSVAWDCQKNSGQQC